MESVVKVRVLDIFSVVWNIIFDDGLEFVCVLGDGDVGFELFVSIFEVFDSSNKDGE